MKGDTPWAVSVVVSEAFLNGMAASGIGDGIEAPGFRNTFHLPMMGPIEMSVGMTIVGVSFEMRASDANRLRATVRAAGLIEVHGNSPMPSFPGLAHVAGEVLVDPEIAFNADGTFVARLDLPGSELVGVRLEGIDGVEADESVAVQMGEMLFAAVGGELFEGLAARLGPFGLELGAEDALVMSELGVRPGPADVRVDDGRLLVGLRAVEGLEGRAQAVEVTDGGAGVGVAAGALASLVSRLAADKLGRSLPFELDLETRERRVGGRIRSTRLVGSEHLPDLRAGLRYTIRPRLDGDDLEISVREAWFELPLVPSFVNDVNRWFGGAASRAPWTVRIPSRTSVPVRPGSDVTMDIGVVSLDVGDDGVHAMVEAHLE